MTTLVYRYGLTAPIEGANLVREELRLAHRYRNVLTEIERGRRAAVRAVESEMSGDLPTLVRAVEDADAECEAAAKEIKKARAAARKHAETDAMRSRLMLARVRKSDLLRTLRERRAELRSQCSECKKNKGDNPCPHATREAVALRHALDAITERAGELRRSAREHSGLFWGTYLLVEDAASRAFGDTPLYGDDGITPNDPKFQRWTRAGAIGCQLQGGENKPPRTVAQVTGGQDTRVKITLPPAGTWDHESWGERRRRARQGELAMRVTKDGRWARWRLDMHRPLPEGAIITWVVVHVEEVGPHTRWYVTLTVEAERPGRSDYGRCASVAVDIGWRQLDDELRVCGWRAEGCDDPPVVVRANELLRAAGDPKRRKTDAPYALPPAGELRLDARTIAMLRESESVRSKRDLLFNQQIASLSVWLAGREDLPEPMLKASKNLVHWRAASRLVRLLAVWREHRVPGDEAVFNSLDAWATADWHYWEQEAVRRSHALLRRRDVYRIFAVALARSYETIVIEQFDLRTMARRPDIASDESVNETARSNRQLAALSDLRGGPNSSGTLQDAARAHGASVVAMPAHDTTTTCPSCGLVADRQAEKGVRLSCECGHAWDQDIDGAPRVLHVRWHERPGDAKIVVGAREAGKDAEPKEKGESRWARAKRLRVQKEARMATAREAGDDGAE